MRTRAVQAEPVWHLAREDHFGRFCQYPSAMRFVRSNDGQYLDPDGDSPSDAPVVGYGLIFMVSTRWVRAAPTTLAELIQRGSDELAERRPHASHLVILELGTQLSLPDDVRDQNPLAFIKFHVCEEVYNALARNQDNYTAVNDIIMRIMHTGAVIDAARKARRAYPERFTERYGEGEYDWLSSPAVDVIVHAIGYRDQKAYEREMFKFDLQPQDMPDASRSRRHATRNKHSRKGEPVHDAGGRDQTRPLLDGAADSEDEHDNTGVNNGGDGDGGGTPASETELADIAMRG